MDLRTERLLIRDLDPYGDAADLLPLYRDETVMRFIGGQTMADEEAVSAFLARRLGNAAPAPLGFWAVCERDGTVIGTCLLDTPPFSRDPFVPSPDVQIGGAMRRDRWRRGYARELGTALLRHAFETLGLSSVIALAEPEHPVSHGLVGELGFTAEGETLDYYDGVALLRYRLTREGSCA